MKTLYARRRDSFSDKVIRVLGISLLASVTITASMFAYRYYTNTIDKIAQIESGKLYTQEQMQDIVDSAIEMAKRDCTQNVVADNQPTIKESFPTSDISAKNDSEPPKEEVSFLKIREKNIEDDRSHETFAKLQSIIEVLKQKELEARKERLRKKLNIASAKHPSTKEKTKHKVITIKKGDTLYSIALKRYKSTKYISKILEANPKLKKNPDNLRVGDKIILPL